MTGMLGRWRSMRGNGRRRLTTACKRRSSHWPGNRTPPELKADLSTGICLSFARAPAEYQQTVLAGAEAVVNDHYDTDGFLSMLAIVRPDVALAREFFSRTVGLREGRVAFDRPTDTLADEDYARLYELERRDDG